MNLEDIIIEPILTEKSNTLRERKKFAFKVDQRANKIQIKQAVERLFNVHPIGCNIVIVKSKPKKVRYKLGRTASWKKAIVTLPAEETISIFEGV